jgi:hypothetical protein
LPGRTPLNQRSARHTGRCLHNTQQTPETNIHIFRGIRTRDPSIPVATELLIRLHGHRGRENLLNRVLLDVRNLL